MSRSNGPISFNDVRWQYLSAEGAEELRNLKLAGFEHDSEVVKSTPTRQVVRVGRVFAKEIKCGLLQGLIKSVAGGNACKEGKISLELQKRGIRVPEVLGFGSVRTLGLLRRDVLLTREVSDSRTAHEIFHRHYPAWPLEKKRRSIEQFAYFLKGLHDKGVLHTDLHIGNILFSEKKEVNRLLLLDTDRVKLRGQGLSWRDRRRNLAQILSNFRVMTSRTEQFRFAKAYGLKRDSNGRKMMLDVDRSSLKYSMRIWWKKSLQSLGTNRRFAKENRDGFTAYYRRSALAETLFAALLPDPDLLMTTGRILKAGRTVHAAEVIIDGNSYFLKRYNRKGAIYSFRNAFRRSRAVRTWLNTWGYRVRNLPVPKPLICLEERRFGLLGRTYILSEFVDSGRNLSLAWSDLQEEERRSLLLRLALLLGRLHRFGCVHGDLKWSNILLCRNNLTVFLTDLDGASISGRKRRKLKSRDIGRFLKDLQGRIDEKSFQGFFEIWRELSCVGR